MKGILDHEGVISSLKNDFIPMLESSILPSWHQRAFDEMKDAVENMDKEYFALLKKSGKGKLIGTLLGQKEKGIDMIEVYNNHLYIHRNRCAHNTKSYQEEQPSLKSMTTSGYNNENYFLWYAILIIIDSVMINLYKTFLEVPVL